MIWGSDFPMGRRKAGVSISLNLYPTTPLGSLPSQPVSYWLDEHWLDENAANTGVLVFGPALLDAREEVEGFSPLLVLLGVVQICYMFHGLTRCSLDLFTVKYIYKRFPLPVGTFTIMNSHC